MLLSRHLSAHCMCHLRRKEGGNSFRGNRKFDRASDLCAAWLVNTLVWVRAPPGMPTKVLPRLQRSGLHPAPHTGGEKRENLFLKWAGGSGGGRKED